MVIVTKAIKKKLKQSLASLKKYSDDTIVHENDIIAKAKRRIKKLQSNSNDCNERYSKQKHIEHI